MFHCNLCVTYMYSNGGGTAVPKQALRIIKSSVGWWNRRLMFKGLSQRTLYSSLNRIKNIINN